MRVVQPEMSLCISFLVPGRKDVHMCCSHMVLALTCSCTSACLLFLQGSLGWDDWWRSSVMAVGAQADENSRRPVGGPATTATVGVQDSRLEEWQQQQQQHSTHERCQLTIGAVASPIDKNNTQGPPFQQLTNSSPMLALIMWLLLHCASDSNAHLLCCL